MFKAKISRNPSIQVFYWITIIVSSVFVVPMTYASGISFDALIQKISQLGVKNSIESSSSHRGQRDLFVHTLDNGHAQGNKSTLQSIDNILTIITDNALQQGTICNIKKSDIITILSRTPGFIEEVSSKGDIPLGTLIQSAGDLKPSCERLLRCNQTLIPSQEITQKRELSDCTSVLYETYTIHKNLRVDQLSLANKNNNDNIYSDGIKDNALFDLMIDLTHIKDILFEKDTGPATPKMIYYSLPTTIAPSTDNQQDTIPGGIAVFGGQNNTSTTIGGTNTNGGGTNTTTIGTLGSGTSNTNTLPTISNFIHDITTTNRANITTIPTAKIQASLCPTPGSTTLDTIDTIPLVTEKDNAGTIDALYATQNELIDALSGFLYTPDDVVGGVIGGGNNGANNIIKTDNAVPSTTLACKQTCTDTTGTEKLICEGKCCLNSCNQINNIKDKAVCISQCLCGEVSTANDMLRIKICRIPAQPARVLAGKKIFSIQEAVIEINEIFTKLKQNGLLSKRSKTQEFMDSSFSKIKFHEILAFDIFVAIKPIYDKLQSTQKKEKTKKANDTIKTINGFIGGKLGIGSDKNKYMIVGDTRDGDTWIKYCTSLGQIFNPDIKKCDKQTDNIMIEQLSKTNTSSVINDQFYTFQKEQYGLRTQIYKQIVDMQTTANILKTKGEKAQ